MIDARELRIGNWVSLDKEVRQVERWMFIQECENMSAIPLTPEILIKCGLINGSVFADINYFKIEEGSLYFEDIYTCVDIKYLHQFQNLYHALTQTELEIQL